MEKTITILGAGSSGMTTAAWLEMEGWKTTLWDTPEEAGDFEAIRRQGGILLRGGSGKTGCAMPWRMTTDLAAAVEGARLLLVCTSAGRHRELAEQLAPLAKAGQAILLNPGNFGSFFFRRELEKAGKTGVLLGELSGCLWACRRTAPGEVLSANPLKTGRAAALPSADTPELIRAFEAAFPLEPAKNVLEASLNSPNVISHVAGAVLNAVEIEKRGKEYAFFLEGLGEPVLRCFAVLEKERNAVLEKMGLSVYNPSSQGFMRSIMDRDSHPELDWFRGLDGPSSFQHRYVSEDAACGMAMLVSLGECCGVPTPLTRSFLTIAGAINGADYLKEGRTLQNLGLGGLTPETLSARLSDPTSAPAA